jgi:hypothetical protein
LTALGVVLWIICLTYIVAVMAASWAWRKEPTLRRLANAWAIGLFPFALLWFAGVVSSSHEGFYIFDDFNLLPFLGSGTPFSNGAKISLAFLIAICIIIWDLARSKENPDAKIQDHKPAKQGMARKGDGH